MLGPKGWIGSLRDNPWTAVCILCLLYVASFLDRMILVLLVEPISSELALSDVQMGLLIGIAFAFLYVLVGLPLAHLIDKGHRMVVLIVGTLLWGTATLLSAFAESYASLLALRAMVAVGEASLSPAAISLIGDLFPRHRRSFPTSIYMATGVVMGTGAFILGGGAIELATVLSEVVGWRPWRMTLVLVSIPTLILALVAVVLVKDPGFGRVPESEVQEASAIIYLKNNWRLFLGVFGAVGTLSIISWGIISWVPSLLIRAHQIEIAHAGYIFGLIGVPAGVFGTLFGPWGANKLARHGRTDAVPLVLLGMACLCGVSLFATSTSANTWIFLAGIAVAMFALTASTVLPATVIQSLSPPRMRARLMAINLMFLGILGQGLGPVVVALASEGFDSDYALGYGITVSMIVTVPISIVLLLVARQDFVRRGQSTP